MNKRILIVDDDVITVWRCVLGKFFHC